MSVVQFGYVDFLTGQIHDGLFWWFSRPRQWRNGPTNIKYAVITPGQYYHWTLEDYLDYQFSNYQGVVSFSNNILVMDVSPYFTPWVAAPPGTGVYMAEKAYLKTNTAADYDRATSQEHLYNPAPPMLVGTGEGFWRALWVKVENLSAHHTVMESINSQGWQIRVSSGSGNVYFRILDSVGIKGAFNETVPCTVGNWCMIYAEYDGTNLRVSVNDSVFAVSPDCDAYAPPTTNNFRIGNGGYGATDGAVQNAMGGHGTLSAQQITALYNSGAGCTQSEIESIVGADGFLYRLSEKTGAAVDVFGNAPDLGAINSPGITAGLIEDEVVDRAPVRRWVDRLGVLPDLEQGDITRQPVWDEANKAVEGDGVDDRMDCSLSLGSPSEFIAVGKAVAGVGPLVAGSSSQYCAIVNYDSKYYFRWNGTAENTVAMTNDTHVYSALVDGSSSYIRADGVSAVGPVDVGSGTSSDLSVLGIVDGGLGFNDGPIHYVQVLPGALNDDEYRASVEAWLMDYYGISV